MGDCLCLIVFVFLEEVFVILCIVSWVDSIDDFINIGVYYLS